MSSHYVLLADDDIDFSIHRGRRSFNQKEGKGAQSEGNSLKLPSTSRNKSNVFATRNSTAILAQTGGTASLPCVVRKFSNGVVS